MRRKVSDLVRCEVCGGVKKQAKWDVSCDVCGKKVPDDVSTKDYIRYFDIVYERVVGP